MHWPYVWPLTTKFLGVAARTCILYTSVGCWRRIISADSLNCIIDMEGSERLCTVLLILGTWIFTSEDVNCEFLGYMLSLFPLLQPFLVWIISRRDVKLYLETLMVKLNNRSTCTTLIFFGHFPMYQPPATFIRFWWHESGSKPLNHARDSW